MLTEALAGVSYRRIEWRSHAYCSSLRPALVQAYHAKVSKGKDPVSDAGTPDGVRPEWRNAERIFAMREVRGKRQYQVKWFMLGYAESTWEDEAALTSDEVRPIAPSACEHNAPELFVSCTA